MIVVFDLDGTLADSLPGIAWAANGALAEIGAGPLDQAVIAGFVGLGEQVFVDRLRAAAAPGCDRGALLAAFMRLYPQAGDRTTPMPGAEPAMDRLAAGGARLGLCTNKPSGPTDAVLAALGWQGRFDVVIAGDTLPVRKPDPAPLFAAFDALGGRGLYVGDSAVDGEAAARAGVPFLLFTEGIRDVPIGDIPHRAAFDDFADLPDLCAALWP